MKHKAMNENLIEKNTADAIEAFFDENGAGAAFYNAYENTDFAWLRLDGADEYTAKYNTGLSEKEPKPMAEFGTLGEYDNTD